MNKRALESMAKAGAFDELNPNRAQVLAGVETLIATSAAPVPRQRLARMTCFGAATGSKEEELVLP